MKTILQIILLGLWLFFSGCTDWRTDAFEDKRFDVENSFIRFNYGFVLNQGAQDSLVLNIDDIADTISISIPIAMSSPLQEDTTTIELQRTIMNTMENMQILWPNGQSEGNGYEVEIRPNELETQLNIQIWEPEPAEILFELIENSANFSLGFPESGAHSRFKIIIQ